MDVLNVLATIVVFALGFIMGCAMTIKEYEKKSTGNSNSNQELRLKKNLSFSMSLLKEPFDKDRPFVMVKLNDYKKKRDKNDKDYLKLLIYKNNVIEGYNSKKTRLIVGKLDNDNNIYLADYRLDDFHEITVFVGKVNFTRKSVDTILFNQYEVSIPPKALVGEEFLDDQALFSLKSKVFEEFKPTEEIKLEKIPEFKFDRTEMRYDMDSIKEQFRNTDSYSEKDKKLALKIMGGNYYDYAL